MGLHNGGRSGEAGIVSIGTSRWEVNGIGKGLIEAIEAL